MIRIVFLSVLFIFCSFKGISQTLPNFSNINIAELSDDQIRSLLIKASALGYSRTDVLEIAKNQGISNQQIVEFTERVNRLNGTQINDVNPSELVGSKRISLDTLKRIEFSSLIAESEIFGFDFFQSNSNSNSSEPNLNIPTPQDYILGSGDELTILIYGNSEHIYKESINQEGNLSIKNLGPIFLSGLSIKQAELALKTSLSSLYPDLINDASNTFLSLSLSKVRTINVSVVGEVNAPGAYTLSGYSTISNVLHSAGGITQNGSLRNVIVNRNNKIIAKWDAYGFLLNGDNKYNIRLENNDVVVVKPYVNRVLIHGAVKRPAKYELEESETLSDLIEYAGGFKEDAFEGSISVIRNSIKEKVIADVFKSQYDIFQPEPGDVYQVKQILDRYTNRVKIMGSVFRPGDYSIDDEGLTVKQLILKAEGLTGDVNLDRAMIIKANNDLSTETISFNLGKLMSGAIDDILLNREDVVKIFSIYDLKEESYVTISGEVNDAGVFGFSNNLTVEDLIIMAGGLKNSASASKIEITRRYQEGSEGQFSEAMVIDIDKNLGVSENQFLLQPFDNIVVRRNPNYFDQKTVSIEGEIIYPGNYAIQGPLERISDLLKRAGGVNRFAYIEGATLLRKTEFYKDESEIELRLSELEGLLDRFERKDQSLTELEIAKIARVKQQMSLIFNEEIDGKALSNYAKRERLREIVQRNSLFGDVKLNEADAIGIDLKGILENPTSKHNLILEDGDVLIIPKKQETVRLRGRILYPTTVVYEQSRSMKYFIDRAGGFGNRALRKGAYVIYPNGNVAKTRSFLFFKKYPKVQPGSDIIIPAKPPKLPIALSEVLGITSGLATLALLVSQINFN